MDSLRTKTRGEGKKREAHKTCKALKHGKGRKKSTAKPFPPSLGVLAAGGLHTEVK
jgi:hypothetical protein